MAKPKGSRDRLNKKQIAAVNYLMKGYRQKEAARLAGYSENSVKNGAWFIFNNPVVKAEVEKRQKKMAERNKLTEDWIVQRLMRIADTSIGDILELDAEGNPRLNFELMTPELKKSLKRFEQTEFKDGRGPNAGKKNVMKVEKEDTLRALELLMKILGIGSDKVEVKMEEDTINQIWASRINKAKELEDGST